MHHALRARLLTTALAAILTSCSVAAPGGLLPAPTATTNTERAATVRFAIAIPRRRAHRRRPGFVSPSTQSMSIAIAPAAGGPPVVTGKLNLAPTSNGCATSSGSTVCRFTLALAPGAYLAAVATYDALNEGGSVLSLGESLPVHVVAGAANAVGLTLGGVPHTLTISPGAATVTAAQAGGFDFSGSGALLVTATDADGNAIVGPGTPYTAAVVAGSGWTVQSKPGAKSPNRFNVTPGPNKSTATIRLSVAYDAATCAAPGVVCSTTVSVTSKSIQYLFVADCERGCNQSALSDAIDVYAPPYTGAPIATITTGILNPVALAVDGTGKLDVASCGTCTHKGIDSITEYAPPFTNASAPAATLVDGILHPVSIALNSANDLFAFNCAATCGLSGTDTIERFASPFANSSEPATTIFPGIHVSTIAVDSNDTLLALACPYLGCYAVGTNPASVLAYAPPYDGTPVAVSKGIGNPLALAVDANGHMFVASQDVCALPPCTTYSIAAYAAPYSASSTPFATISNGLHYPESMAFDASGNLYAVNGNGTTGDVTEYGAPNFSDASPTTLFASTPALFQSGQLAVDGSSDIIVATGKAVYASAPPYAGLTQIASGLGFTSAIALSP